MIPKFLVLPVRSLIRQGRQTVISLTGLSIALSCCILILLYIRFDLSFDRYHKNAKNIYRVLTKNGDGHSYMGKNLNVVTPATLKNALLTDIPEVEKACRCKARSVTVEYNSSLFAESGFLYADPEFLEMFSFPVLTGNPEALKDPFSLFITRRMALKYFGDQEPVGKLVKVNNLYVYTVKGVLEDIPLNSHLMFDFLTGFETLFSVSGGREIVERWPNFSYLTYVQLQDGSSPENINKILDSIAPRYLSDPFFKGTTWFLRPLRKIHLGGQNNFDPSIQSDIRTVYLIASIGISIFLIACINYMTMATARSFSRGREIGIIKVAGSSRSKLVFQLISESVLLSMAALLAALTIVFFTLPAFAGLTERPLTYNMLLSNSMPVLILILCICMGIMAGFMPALWLSSFNPLRLIREEFIDYSGKRKSGFLRNILVGIQYVISIVALVSAFTVSAQFRYLKNKDQGFNSKNVIIIELKDPNLKKSPFYLINEIRNNPRISGVSASNSLPNNISSAGLGKWDGKPDELQASIFQIAIDSNFIDFYDLKLVSGRRFSEYLSDDSLNNFLINEKAARLLGTEDPVGMRFGFLKNAPGRIIGVVKDFNFQSLKLPIEPLAISAIPTSQFPVFEYISVKVNEGYIQEIMLFLGKILKEVSPGYLNPVSVLSERIESMYVSDRRLAGIILFSTVLAVVLTCLGQYSLSFYTARKRTREMSLRKVFGATPAKVMALFTILAFDTVAGRQFLSPPGQSAQNV
jgi:ABC-type antimicrobial peptide transport system permease subunit